jgi:ABC-type transport system involved in multi-copper enzyme maturation permease subunit
MIKTLLFKEIKNTIATFKFQFVTILAVLISTVYLYIGLNEYKAKVENFNLVVQKNEETLRNINVYSFLKPTIANPPRVLSIFCKGSENGMGASIKINPFEIPIESKKEITHNNYLASSFDFDFNNVITVLFSLLALLISFNCISEEHEKGTLKLLLSNFIPKSKIIIAKIIACQWSISIPLLLIFFIAFIMLLTSPLVLLNADDILRIITIFIFYEIYIISFILIGSLISILTKKSSVALILCLFIWLFNIVIIPNGSIFIAESLTTKRSKLEINKEKETKNGDTDMLINKWREQNPMPGQEYAFGYINFNDIEKTYITRGVHPVFINWCEKRFGFINDLYIKNADKMYDLDKTNTDGEKKQAILCDRMASFSITYLLNTIIENFAGTSWNDQDQFLKNAQQYRMNLISYINNNNGFSSRRWFTDDSPNDEPWVTDPLHFNINALNNDMQVQYKAYYATKICDVLPERKLKLEGMPTFKNISISYFSSYLNVLFRSILVIFYCGFLLFFILTVFNRHSVAN